MQIIHGVRNLSVTSASGNASTSALGRESSILTIGNFDGVHLGHQALVKRVVERAREKKVAAVVMTFEPHPVKVLYPDRQLKRIFDLDDQTEQLEKLGVDLLVIEPFSREFSQLEPERYLLEWIYRPFVPETLVVGYDFSFGANRKGSIDFLQEHAPALGVRVEVVPPVKVGDVLVSSSRIRQALESGDVYLANQLLGRHFYLEGIVERGAGRGRKIGVPTANLRSSAELLPARGVYAAWVHARETRWKAAVNVGFNPTFTDDESHPISVEAHLIDFDAGDRGPLYGESIQIEFVQRLRDEMKFSSVDQLVERIRGDIVDAAKTLEKQPPKTPQEKR